MNYAISISVAFWKVAVLEVYENECSNSLILFWKFDLLKGLIEKTWCFGITSQ